MHEAHRDDMSNEISGAAIIAKPFTAFLARRYGTWPPPQGALPPGYPNMTWETYAMNAMVDFMDERFT